MSEDIVTSDLPESLAEIVTDFAETDPADRLQLLLEFSSELPELPARFADHPELLEPVPECQSPIFLVTEVDDPEQGEQAIVRLHFSLRRRPRRRAASRGSSPKARRPVRRGGPLHPRGPAPASVADRGGQPVAPARNERHALAHPAAGV